MKFYNVTYIVFENEDQEGYTKREWFSNIKQAKKRHTQLIRQKKQILGSMFGKLKSAM